MLASKYSTSIVTALMAGGTALCLLALLFAPTLAAAFGENGLSMAYESVLFRQDEVLEVNIRMDEDEWAEMLATATAEEYHLCDVEIAGETFYRVGIRPKGNTSLSSIASDPDSDRYSFKLEFDQFVDGQTCFGLDKLILNNNYADATNLKEALIYDMFAFIGADASRYSFCAVSVNGEYWGCYLALEAVEESFMLRNWGAEQGELYKPDSMNIGGGGFGGGMLGGGGANLNYTDDSLDSYSTIWAGEVTSTSTADHKRVVAALKQIFAGENIDEVMDVDNLVKYMAVHIFAVNDDSLSGSMAHNYYLYEHGGRLNILPWDYNLSLGGMGMGGSSSATDVVNSPIDDAFSGTNFFDTLLADADGHAAYYACLRTLVDDYLLGDGFEQFYTRARGQLDALVERDPNALFSYDEYLVAVEILYELVKLRGQSIDGQLTGAIPSTANEQRGSDAFVDASHLDLSVLGSMGGGFGGGRGDMGDRFNFGQGDASFDAPETAEPPVNSTAFTSAMPQMPEGFDPSQFGDGQMPGGQMGELPEGFDPSQFGGGQMPWGSGSSEPDASGESGAQASRPNREQSGMPGMSFGGAASGASTETLALYGLSALVLGGGLTFAALYHRKPRKR